MDDDVTPGCVVFTIGEVGYRPDDNSDRGKLNGLVVELATSLLNSMDGVFDILGFAKNEFRISLILFDRCFLIGFTSIVQI